MCDGGTLSSEWRSVQRESEQLANEETSVKEGWKVVSIYFCVFNGIFGMRKVQCYLSVQVTVLLEIWIMATSKLLNMKFCFSQNTFFLIPRNKKHTLTCQGGTDCYRAVNYQPGS